MGNKMTRDELLASCCSKSEYRPNLQRPFLQGGYVIATDAHSILALPKEDEDTINYIPLAAPDVTPYLNAYDETEKRGWTMPNKKRWDLIDAYREQIDKLIEEAGGDSLNDLFWSVARYGSSYAWLYLGGTGTLLTNILYRTYSVRPLAYFKS